MSAGWVAEYRDPVMFCTIKGRADTMTEARDRIEAEAARLGAIVVRVVGMATPTGVEYSATLRAP